MADIVISIVSKATEYLVEPAIRQGKYLLSANKFIGELENEKKELISERDELENRVEQAKYRAEEIEKPVEKWLNDVKNILEEVAELEQRMRAENTSFCIQGQCPTLTRYRLCKQIVKKINSMEKFKGKSNIHPFSHPATLLGIQSLENFTCFESTKVADNQLLDAIHDDEIYMIGLYGMGGSGKTTLVTEVGKKVEELFDKIILVTVSQTPNIRDIQGKIADMLNLKLVEESEEGRAQRLWLSLKENKRVLVIVDDLWREFNLKDIGIHLDNDNKGQWKIIVTTRNQHICDLMHCQKKIYLGLLSEFESWTLFKKHASIDDGFSKSLNDVPQKLCQECKGLPVAIKAVGSSLKGKSNADWKASFHILRNSDSETIDDHVEGVGAALSCLKLSYDYLSDKEKLLFLMCSMFPEDYKLSIEDMIRYAIGLGLGGEFSLDSKRDVIEAKINKLLESCLLMNAGENKEYVKMHDTVRDTALWIANRSENHKILVNVDKPFSTLAEEDSIRDCFAVSSWYYVEDQYFRQLHAPKLEILLLNSRKWKSFDLSRSSFEGIKGVKVFSLINNGYGNPSLSLPSTTNLLTNLQTVRLNRLKLGDISFITSLTRLEVLDLRHCNLNEIPYIIWKSKRLKLLDLSYCCFVQENYNGAIGKCSQLEELYASKCRPKEYLSQIVVDTITHPNLQRFVIHTDRSRDFAKTSRHLELLDFNISSLRQSRKNLLQVTKSAHLIHLLGGCKNIIPNMVEVVGSMNGLTCLSLESCLEIECIFETASDFEVDHLIPNLVELVLIGLENLKELCRGSPLQVLSFFERLEKLEIQQCSKFQSLFPWECKLQNLTILKISYTKFGESVFSMSVAHSLQQLEVLEVANCDDLRFIISSGRELSGNEIETVLAPSLTLRSSHFVMSRLKKLKISYCRKLESVFPICFIEGLAPLEEIQITQAPQLKLVFGECDHQYHSSHQNQNQNQNLHTYLKCLKLTDLDNLVGICPENNCAMWPSSTTVIVEKCPKLSASWIATMVGSKDRERVVEVEKLTLRGFCGMSNISKVGNTPRHILSLQNLRLLAISTCKSLKSVFSMEVHRILPELMSIRIYNCQELEQIIEENEELMKLHNTEEVCFPKLTSIKIVNCNKLKSLFSVVMIRMLPKLSILEVSETTQLEEIFRHGRGEDTINDAEILLPNLTKIQFHKLSSFVDICKGYKLQSVKLKHVEIVECPKIASSLREIQVTPHFNRRNKENMIEE